jgi:long-chain acyl-CoA synthetase
VRLEAVPEMGYDPAAEPPTGEVCIRGPGLFSGYYKQPELTKECMGEWKSKQARLQRPCHCTCCSS